jgi:hypothetical protein
MLYGVAKANILDTSKQRRNFTDSRATVSPLLQRIFYFKQQELNELICAHRCPEQGQVTAEYIIRNNNSNNNNNNNNNNLDYVKIP